MVLTSCRHPQVGDVSASIFVVSPVANAMLKSSMNARAVARTFIAMTSADVGSVARLRCWSASGLGLLDEQALADRGWGG